MLLQTGRCSFSTLLPKHRVTAHQSPWRTPCRASSIVQQLEHVVDTPVSNPALDSHLIINTDSRSLQQRQHLQRQDHAADDSGSGRPSCSVSLHQQQQQPQGVQQQEQLQMHRPLTSGVTPATLAAMAEMLRLPLRQMQRVLQRHPQLADLSPQQLSSLLQSLQHELGFSKHHARLMLTHHGDLVVQVPASQLRARAHTLAQHLGLPAEQVMAACGSLPSLLRRRPADVCSRLQRLGAALGGLCVHDALQLAGKAPQLMSASPGCVSQRLARVCRVLRRPPRLLMRGLQQQPDLLFISPRILRNKVAVLQAILDRPLRLVAPVLMACPKLLRTDLDAVRASFSVLQPISGRDHGFSFGMVCHAPHLLLQHPQLLVGQARHVHQLVRGCRSWREQLRRFSPAQLADCLCLTAPTYARLNYLVATQQADSIPLLEALSMPRTAFMARFPDAASRLDVRRKQVPLLPIPRWNPPPRTSSEYQTAAVAGVPEHQRGGQAPCLPTSWLLGLGLAAKQVPAGAAAAAAARTRAAAAAATTREAFVTAARLSAAAAALPSGVPGLHELPGWIQPSHPELQPPQQPQQLHTCGASDQSAGQRPGHQPVTEAGQAPWRAAWSPAAAVEPGAHAHGGHHDAAGIDAARPVDTAGQPVWGLQPVAWPQQQHPANWRTGAGQQQGRHTHDASQSLQEAAAGSSQAHSNGSSNGNSSGSSSSAAAAPGQRVRSRRRMAGPRGNASATAGLPSPVQPQQQQPALPVGNGWHPAGASLQPHLPQLQAAGEPSHAHIPYLQQGHSAAAGALGTVLEAGSMLQGSGIQLVGWAAQHSMHGAGALQPGLDASQQAGPGAAWSDDDSSASSSNGYRHAGDSSGSRQHRVDPSLQGLQQPAVSLQHLATHGQGGMPQHLLYPAAMAQHANGEQPSQRGGRAPSPGMQGTQRSRRAGRQAARSQPQTLEAPAAAGAAQTGAEPAGSMCHEELQVISSLGISQAQQHSVLTHR